MKVLGPVLNINVGSFFFFLPVQFIKPVHASLLHMFHTFACKTLYNIFYIQFVKVCMLFKSHLDKIFVTLMKVHCELFLHCCSTRIAIMFSFMEMLSCSVNESFNAILACAQNCKQLKNIFKI